MPQGWEWLIILAIALLLFGGTKLAGLGKASGRAIREFKEETRAIKDDEKTAKPADAQALPATEGTVAQGEHVQAEPVQAEIVDPNRPSA